MMNKEKSGFFSCGEEISPEAIKKTIRKGNAQTGDARTINEVVEKMELSRSVDYKWPVRIYVLFCEASQNKIVTLTFLLEHKKGVFVQSAHH